MQGIAQRLPEADLYFYAQDPKQKVAALEKLLSRVYQSLVDSRKDYAKLSEDALSNIICKMLSLLGIVANHDVKRGGHVDITVEDHETQFLWVAEAKIHRGNSWTDAGFLQLTDRYGRSTFGRDHAEVLIYHLEGEMNSATVLDNWKQYVSENHKDVELVEDEVSTHLYFRTVHACHGSGLAYHVRHLIVPMTHNPIK